MKTLSIDTRAVEPVPSVLGKVIQDTLTTDQCIQAVHALRLLRDPALLSHIRKAELSEAVDAVLYDLNDDSLSVLFFTIDTARDELNATWKRIIDEGFLVTDDGSNYHKLESIDDVTPTTAIVRELGIRQPYFQGYAHPTETGLILYSTDCNFNITATSDEINWSQVTEFTVLKET